MILQDLGNIYSSANSFTTKAAILQSVYRVNSNFPIGKKVINTFIGKDQNGKKLYRSELKEYGHLVEGGYNKNMNFYYPETFQYAHQRVNNKLADETIKKDRLFNNLLSSMPLAFNLFHPLMIYLKKDPEFVSMLFSSLFPELDIKVIDKIDIEFIPTPITAYIDDKSAMDAVIFFRDKENKENIISIEVKYTDKLGSNCAAKNDLKVLTAKDSGFFSEEGLQFINIGCPQIYRNFLLTEKYRMVHDLSNSYSIILVPQDHPTTESEITFLKKNLTTSCPESKLKKYSLEAFVQIISENINEELKPWIDWFYERYLNFSLVSKLYMELKKQ